MEYEPGDEYDCEACGGTHVVERGKGLRVTGSSDGLDPTPYVRCPEVGVLSLAAGEPEGGTDAAVEGSGDDWP